MREEVRLTKILSLMLAEEARVNIYKVVYIIANYTGAAPMQDYEVAYILDESVNNIRAAKISAFKKIEGVLFE